MSVPIVVKRRDTRLDFAGRAVCNGTYKETVDAEYLLKRDMVSSAVNFCKEEEEEEDEGV